MKITSLSVFLIFILTSYSYSQSCPGDVVILEDENLSVWKVESNGTQIFSLSEFQGTVNIGDSTYFQDDFGFNARGLILMAHNLTGGLLWSRRLDGADSHFTTNPALTADGTNVYIAAAQSLNFNANHNFKVEAYNALNGAISWQNSTIIPVTNNSPLPFGAQVNPYAAGIDGAGNLIVAGAFSDSLTIAGTTLATVTGISETFVMSLNTTNGSELWATQSTGSNGRARAWTLGISPTNEIVLGGHFTGSLSFGGAPFSSADNTTINAYIAKLSTIDGSQIWVQGFEGQTPGSFNNIYDIDFDSGGNIYYAGSFNDAINVQGNLVNSAAAGEGGTDALIGAMDTNGNFRWASQLGGKSTSDEFATTIVYSASASALFVGAQLATDSLHYQNTYQAYPSLAGHYVYGVSPADGSIDPNLGNVISSESNFGYSAVYDDGTNSYISASLQRNTGKNILAAQWIPNRPIPIVNVTLEDGILNPTEFLTAFNPGGGLYTYQWYFNGNALAPQIADTLTAVVNGKYSVEVSNSNGCSIFSKEILLLDGSTLESDSLVLVDLYNSTNGSGWVDNTNWLVGNVNTWFGISTNGSRVTNIDLNNNNLAGNFPASIGNSGALSYLTLYGNPNLTGQVPTNIWNLTNLIYFDINGATNLTFEITSDIQNLTQLQVIQAGQTNISGIIPPEIGLVTTLNYLDLGSGMGNQLSGSIPTEIGNLINLTTLNLGGGNLTGSLPASIGNLTNLTFLALWDNELTGAIPAEIGNLVSLVEFYADDNQFSGTLPSEFGNLSNLQHVNLGRNQISGPLPLSLANLGLLISLDLTGNPINDVVPPELANLTSLITLSLNNCQLQGVFPDAIWQNSALQGLDIGNNNSLQVVLPSNLATLTNFTDIRIDNTLPRGGAFPVDFYSLTNLVGLSLGNKQYTGTLDPAGVDNWTQLDNIYLWNNFLEGTFPSAITSATNLRALDINNNNFTGFPDVSGLSNLQELNIRSNQLDFNDIAPNIGIPGIIYNPQKQRGANQFLEVDENGNLDLNNTYSAAGNQYQWIRNINDSIASTLDYTITNAKLADLGGYYAIVTNPSVPDLTLRTPFYNVAFSGAPRSWSVDNSPESLADFKSLYAAVYGTNSNDTLYVAGSATPYNVGGLRLDEQRYIYGPGYFLADNAETQANNLEAIVPYINIYEGAAGSEIRGMTWNGIYLNPQSSFLDGILTDIKISGNKIYDMVIGDKNENITIDGNYMDYFSFWSTTPAGGIRTYNNITIQNNIIDTVTTGIAKATALRNEMTNVNFNRNTINVFLDSISDVTLNDNIINNYQATANTVNNTQTYAAAGFINTSGTLSIDNDFQTTNTTFNAGAFSGSTPYALSGLGTTPHIFSITDEGRIRFNVNAKNENESDIQFLNYRIGNNGNVLLTGTVSRLIPGNPVEVLFRPKVSTLPPGGSYNMMIWAKDANGLKSTSHNIPFVAETVTATGNITTSTNAPVTSGEVLLFEINQEGTAFDTLTTTLDNQGKFTLTNIVIGDYLALGKPNPTQFPDQLPTYYQRIDLWEEADTLLIDNSNNQFNISLLEKPKAQAGSGVVAGILEEEIINENNEGGKIEARDRVGGAGVSMRRGRRTGKSDEIIYDLVDFTLTNANGEFIFNNLAVDDYRINIQYPGYPMDTLTNVDIKIEAARNNAYNLAALVDKGKISITILSTTGLLQDLVKAIRVYPNPAAENISIAFNDDIELTGEITASIISITGETVYNGKFKSTEINKDKHLSIPVSIYESGTYILNITQKDKDLGTIRLVILK